jgi:site-specific recombinase XerD
MRLCDSSGKYPWEWTTTDADEFFADLRSVNNLSISSVRSYQTDIRMFCAFATSPVYDWNEQCGRLFGQSFTQVITEFNRAVHLHETDRGSLKRPFSEVELQLFLDHADLEAERIENSKRKGMQAAQRDAVAFKVAAGWGLRRSELVALSVTDFSRNAKAPFFGNVGVLHVRHGKGPRGNPNKQRSVFTLYPWAAEAVYEWMAKGLPRLGSTTGDLFPTDRGGRVSATYLSRKLRQFVDELGFPPGLDMHSLRRAYSTLAQYRDGYDTKFVSIQLGHEHVSTTTIYTFSNPEFAASELHRVLDATVKSSNAKLQKPLPHPSRKAEK